MEEVTRKTLNTIYTLRDCGVNLPYAFFKIIRAIMDLTKEDFGDDRVLLMRESFSSLFRTTNRLQKTKDSYVSTFIHQLLAHWSALILNGTSQFNYLFNMMQSLEAVLVTIRRKSKCSSNKPPVKKRAVPGLNEKTYTSLFELLLQMVASSLSVSKPHKCKNNRHSHNMHRMENGPYNEVIQQLEVFSKLLSFYQFNRDFFPPRLFFSVVKSSLFLIKLCDNQLRHCVQWRTSQHVLSQIGKEKDFAAVGFLQPLVDCVASHCIGGIVSLCHAVKRPTAAKKTHEITNRTVIECSYKHAKAAAGLLYRCEGIKETLQTICQSHHLILPMNLFTSLNDFNCGYSGTAKRKFNRALCSDDVVKKRHCRQRVYNHLHKHSWFLGSSGKTLEKLTEFNSNETNLASSDSEEYPFHFEDDNSVSSSEDDDSFGAIGNWGNNS